MQRCATLAELLSSSDVVNIHCALNPETTNLLNEDTLRLCKPDAYVVNTARGGVVDMDALAVALREGRLAGAGIDVLDVRQPSKMLLFIPSLT